VLPAVPPARSAIWPIDVTPVDQSNTICLEIEPSRNANAMGCRPERDEGSSRAKPLAENRGHTGFLNAAVKALQAANTQWNRLTTTPD